MVWLRVPCRSQESGGMRSGLVLLLGLPLSEAFHSWAAPRQSAPLSGRVTRQEHRTPWCTSTTLRVAAEGDAQGPPGEEGAVPEEGTSRPRSQGFSTPRMRRAVGPARSSGFKKEKGAASTADGKAKDKGAGGEAELLKVIGSWGCIKGCGACCYLAPSERPYLREFFDDDPDDLALYNSLVDDDGWCIHFDKQARACKAYEDRPWFCRVEPESFNKMYGVESGPEMERFCTSCCREQIGDVYGVASPEMRAFNGAIKGLKAGQQLPVIVDPFAAVPPAASEG